jgi:lipoprotein-releasing system permease protein
MPFSWYIAKRYLFSKKSKNAINYITSVSVALVAVVSMALILAMSVFNGLAIFVTSLFTTFDPEIRITHARGGVFTPDSAFVYVQALPSIASYTEALTDDVLLSYGDKQIIAKIKGVSESYVNTTDVSSMLVSGDFDIFDDVVPFVVVGRGISSQLAIGVHFRDALHVYAPKRSSRSSINPMDDFNRKHAYPKGIFSIQQELDNIYVISSINFARDLLEYKNNEVSSIEILLHEQAREQQVIRDIQELLGEDFRVLNREQQHEFLYKITQSEKLVTFLIVSLILIIASFSIVGTLTMLIIEKQRDVQILKSMGASVGTIKKIFIAEGWIISILGAFIGVSVGLLLAYLQQEYGFVKITAASDSFIVDSYPVRIQFTDIFYVLSMVLSVGFFAAFYPVHFVSKKYLS